MIFLGVFVRKVNIHIDQHIGKGVKRKKGLAQPIIAGMLRIMRNGQLCVYKMLPLVLSFTATAP